MNEKSGTAKVQAENTAKTQAEAVIYDIMDYITGHDLKPGDRLPSERELVDMFHVGCILHLLTVILNWIISRSICRQESSLQGNCSSSA